jgi:hypothetical protein
VLARPPGAHRRSAARDVQHRRELLAAAAAAHATNASFAPINAHDCSEGRWIDAAARALTRGDWRAVQAFVAELQRGPLADQDDAARVRAL